MTLIKADLKQLQRFESLDNFLFSAKHRQRMVSSSLTANTLLSIGIACICLVNIEARAVDPSLDLNELIRYSVDHNSNSMQDLSKGNEQTDKQTKGM